VFAGLGVVRRRAEDDHRDDQEEEEHAELVETGLDRQAEYAQSLRVLRQLKDAENSQDPDEDERAALLGALAVAFRLLDHEDDEERQDGQDVEDVHDTETEVTFRRRRHQSEDELHRKPRDADRLNDEERVLVVGSHHRLAEHIVSEWRVEAGAMMWQVDWRRGLGDVDADRSVEARQRFHAEVDDRH